MNKFFLFVLTTAGLFAIASCKKSDTTETISNDAELAVVTYDSGDAITGQYVVILNETSFKFVVDAKADYFERVNEVKSVAP